MFPSILIQLENGPNEFYFYFTNLNDNISPGDVTEGSCSRKDKTVLYWQESEGKTKINKKISYIFFFNFQNIGSGGSVKRKNKTKKQQQQKL